MDFDRIRGGGLPGSPPPPRRLYAADRLAEAEVILYSGDYCIIEKIAGIGYSLERCAGDLLGHYPSKADRTRIGDRLRNGLDELAVPCGDIGTHLNCLLFYWRLAHVILRNKSY